jgi:hypothetical protein
LIVENQVHLSRELPCDPEGQAVAIVDVEAVSEWLETEVEPACSSAWQPGYWAWHLTHVRAVVPPGPVPARLGLYEVHVEGLVLQAGDPADLRRTPGPAEGPDSCTL